MPKLFKNHFEELQCFFFNNPAFEQFETDMKRKRKHDQNTHPPYFNIPTQLTKTNFQGIQFYLRSRIL